MTRITTAPLPPPTNPKTTSTVSMPPSTSASKTPPLYRFILENNYSTRQTFSIYLAPPVSYDPPSSLSQPQPMTLTRLKRTGAWFTKTIEPKSWFKIDWTPEFYAYVSNPSMDSGQFCPVVLGSGVVKGTGYLLKLGEDGKPYLDMKTRKAEAPEGSFEIETCDGS